MTHATRHDESRATPRRRTAAGAPTAPRWIASTARPLARRWLGLDATGTAHVPEHGALVIAATHQSHADPVALGAATTRPLTFLGSSHLDRPGIGAVLRSFGLVTIDRGVADQDALERCLDLLEVGAALVVFPEGGRSRDGRIYRPRSGVARLAAAAGCPVVPAGIDGTARVWPPGRTLPRPTRGAVRVGFGAPLAPPAADPAARREFTGVLHEVLADLAGLPRAEGFLRTAAA